MSTGCYNNSSKFTSQPPEFRESEKSAVLEKSPGMEIPRLQWDSPQVLEYIRTDRPVVLLNCPLSMPAANRWTTDYLASIISPSFPCDIFASDTTRFQYYDDKKNTTYEKFVKPMWKVTASFQEFSEMLREASEPSRGDEDGKIVENKKYYLQQAVVAEMGPGMMEEYMKFSLEAALTFKLAGGWDAFTTNLLLVGSPGVTTPCHFDEQQNLFAQLNGRKRVRLFPPAAWTRLYPYPLTHPCDRQARVVLPRTPGSCVLDSEEDREKFPAFSACTEHNQEYFVDLSAGEVLFVPQYWFHQMEALTENTSLSWWFKHQSKHSGNSEIDLNKVSATAVRRNLERLIGDTVGGGKHSHKFFLAVAAGLVPVPIEIPALPQQGPLFNAAEKEGKAKAKARTLPVASLPQTSTADMATTAQTPVGATTPVVSTATNLSGLLESSPPPPPTPPVTKGGGSDVRTSNAGGENRLAESVAEAGDKDEPLVLKAPTHRLETATAAVMSPAGVGLGTSVVVSGSGSGSGSGSATNSSAVIKSAPKLLRPILPPIDVDIRAAAAEGVVLKPEWEGVVRQAVAISSIVLRPGEAPAFLSELVSGRFSNLEC